MLLNPTLVDLVCKFWSEITQPLHRTDHFVLKQFPLKLPLLLERNELGASLQLILSIVSFLRFGRYVICNWPYAMLANLKSFMKHLSLNEHVVVFLSLESELNKRFGLLIGGCLGRRLLENVEFFLVFAIFTKTYDSLLRLGNEV